MTTTLANQPPRINFGKRRIDEMGQSLIDVRYTLKNRSLILNAMPHLSNAAIIFLIAVCAFFVIAKLLKVEKGAAVLAVAVVILWVVLHLTGYDKTVYRIIFNAPPVEPAKPEDLWKR